MSAPASADHLFSSPEGGDFRVAQEIVRGLESQGISGRMWVDPRAGQDPDRAIHPLPWSPPWGVARLGHRRRRKAIHRQRRAALSGRPPGQEWVHGVRSSREIRYDPAGLRGDLLHLHRLHYAMLDWEIFFRSLPAGHPIVWTQYDAHAFTGGCADPGECERFRERCEQCPLVSDPGPSDLAAEGFDAKARLYPDLNLHLVAASPFLRAQLSGSALGRLARTVRTIPNPQTLDGFPLVDRAAARRKFGIPLGARLVVADAAAFVEPDERARPWRDAFARLAERGEIRLALFGEENLCAVAPVRDLIWIGPVPSGPWESPAYAIGDLYCIPSPREYPWTAFEALATGTPVLCREHRAFSGRLAHERTAWFVSGDAGEELERGILEGLAYWQSDRAPAPGELREHALRTSDPEIRIAAYRALYEEATGRS